MVQVTFFNAGQPTEPYLLMNPYSRKVNFKFLMRNCCIHIIKQELLPWIFSWNWYVTFFLNAHSLIQSCYTLKLMFEESRIFGSKAHGFFSVCCFFFNYLFLFTLALKKTKKSHPFDLAERSKILNLDTCFCRWGPLALLVCKLTGKLLWVQYQLKGHVPKFWSFCILIFPIQKDFPRATWERLFCLIWFSFMFFAHKDT